MRILVTGGSGAIGSHLVEALVRQGCEVHCFLRRPKSQTWLAGLPVHPILGDLTKPETLLNPSFLDSLSRTETLFHLAGQVKGGAFGLVNTAGASILVQAIRRSLRSGGRLKRLVFRFIAVSHGGQIWAATPMTAEKRPDPISLYGRSKLAAETILTRLRPEVEVIIMRPGVVYGPRDKEFVTAVRPIARMGFMVAPNPEQVVSFIYVDDMVELLLKAGLAGGLDDLPLLLADGRVYTTRTACRTMAGILGRSLQLVAAPAWLVHGAAFLSGAAGLVSGRPGIFGLDKARELTRGDWWCDTRPSLEKIGLLSTI